MTTTATCAATLTATFTKNTGRAILIVCRDRFGHGRHGYLCRGHWRERAVEGTDYRTAENARDYLRQNPEDCSDRVLVATADRLPSGVLRLAGIFAGQEVE